MLKYSKAYSAFSVDDIDKAEAFYKNILGLKVEVIEREFYKMLDIYISGDNKVQVYAKPNHEPATFTILYFLVEDAEKAVDELVALGITFEQYKMEGLNTNEKGISSDYGTPPKAWFKDPAGNILSIIENK
jgi:catechol 2,3-dioxygenase-like lactoylglutathione lyase family enzyme